LERQGPLLVGEIPPEVEVVVIPLPAHVDRVVLPGQAQTVAVDGPEGAVQRNRSREVLDLPRLGVHLHDGGGGDGEHLLLTGDQEPAGWSRPLGNDDGVLVLVGDDVARFIREVGHVGCDHAVVDGLNRSIHQDEQDFAGPAGSAGDVHGNHVGDGRSEVRRAELGQSVPASTPEPAVDLVLKPHIHAPRGEILLPPVPR
jgi:hypothetical protein